MADTIIHNGDVGTIIRLTITEDDDTTAVDVSGASVKKFYFLKPDGTKENEKGEFDRDGTDGKLSGGGSTTLTFKSVDGASDVIEAIVDANGNRTSVTLTV